MLISSANGSFWHGMQGKGDLIGIDAEFVALEAEKASVLQVRPTNHDMRIVQETQ